MPPRWSRKPDRNDPEYRRLDDRMNFATHVAIFAVANSALWFFRVLGDTSELSTPASLPWIPWVTLGWLALLAAHGVFIFAIARYETPLPSSTATAGAGFQPKTEKKSAKSAKR